MTLTADRAAKARGRRCEGRSACSFSICSRLQHHITGPAPMSRRRLRGPRGPRGSRGRRNCDRAERSATRLVLTRARASERSAEDDRRRVGTARARPRRALRRTPGPCSTTSDAARRRSRRRSPLERRAPTVVRVRQVEGGLPRRPFPPSTEALVVQMSQRERKAVIDERPPADRRLDCGGRGGGTRRAHGGPSPSALAQVLVSPPSSLARAAGRSVGVARGDRVSRTRAISAAVCSSSGGRACAVEAVGPRRAQVPTAQREGEPREGGQRRARPRGRARPAPGSRGLLGGCLGLRLE